MRYINLPFTYLLSYLLTYLLACLQHSNGQKKQPGRKQPGRTCTALYFNIFLRFDVDTHITYSNIPARLDFTDV